MRSGFNFIWFICNNFGHMFIGYSSHYLFIYDFVFNSFLSRACLKDRYGEPERGGVNGSRSKFFSKEMETPTR
jgi:hypothetical protein